MMKQWAQWKVGIAGCTKAIAGRIVGKGSQTCTRCGTRGHFALFEGGLGKCCHKKKRINPKYTAEKRTRAIDPRIQSEETMALKSRVDQMMDSMGITSLYVFADELGIEKTSLYSWYKGNYGVRGQRNMKIKIECGIERLPKRCEEHVHEEVDNLFDDYQDAVSTPALAAPATGNCWL